MSNILSITNTHINECTDLYIRVFNDKPWNDGWNYETAHKRLNDIYATPNFEGLLYMDNKKVKGAVFGNYEQYYDGIHYYLREMFVSNDSQGTGIGSKLLNSLEERLISLGVSNIYLFTSKGNKTSEFYEKNGFSGYNSMAMMGKKMSIK